MNSKEAGQALASFFLDCAKHLVKGGPLTKKQAAAVAVFLESAQHCLGK